LHNKPNPIGYVEYQRSGVVLPGVDPFDGIQVAVTELQEQGSRENPTLVQYMARIEHTTDGAGVKRWNLYMGFAPSQAAAEPLDPHNLNNSQNQSIGDPARDNLMGAKENKF
jgi:hypothetical protein